MKSSKKMMTHNLKDVVMRELGIELDKEQQTADWGDDLSRDARLRSQGFRSFAPLVKIFDSKLQDEGLQRIMEIEHRALPALIWMSNAGVPFDAESWREHLKRVEEEKNRLELALNKLAPEHPEGKEWNWGSWQQILKAFSLLDIKLDDTKEETLSLRSPLASALLSYKKIAKLTSTYGPSLLEKVEDGRIYASWRQIGAATGRMACSKPNLQNLPPEVRKHVRPRKARCWSRPTTAR
jgi:DNA polymerase-1